MSLFLFFSFYLFFFFNDTATTEIYTLSLHDALPICLPSARRAHDRPGPQPPQRLLRRHPAQYQDRRPDRDRKSTRLNSSHSQISYAVFCLKKKKKNIIEKTGNRYRVDTRSRTDGLD